MLPRLTRFTVFVFLLGMLLALSGCLYDYAPSGPVRSIDTALIGQWATQDKVGHTFTSIVSPASSDHYTVEFQKQGGEPQEFDGWISRVDDFSILVIKSQTPGPNLGKFALYHYEILTPGVPLPGGIGAKRIRLSELQLDESTRTLDSYKLRAAIRKGLKEGTLLIPHDVVADLKSHKEQIPGSIIWSKTGSVTLKGETF
jgi:hypothetical protein